LTWVGPPGGEDEELSVAAGPHRPVVWEEKAEPTIGERRAAGWFAYAPLAQQAGERPPTPRDAIAYWQAQDDTPEEVVPPPASLLCLSADQLSPLELDAVVEDVALTGGTLVVLGRLPDGSRTTRWSRWPGARRCPMSALGRCWR
jgi:hypothetical protein